MSYSNNWSISGVSCISSLKECYKWNGTNRLYNVGMLRLKDDKDIGDNVTFPSNNQMPLYISNNSITTNNKNTVTQMRYMCIPKFLITNKNMCGIGDENGSTNDPFKFNTLTYMYTHSPSEIDTFGFTLYPTIISFMDSFSDFDVDPIFTSECAKDDYGYYDKRDNVPRWVAQVTDTPDDNHFLIASYHHSLRGVYSSDPINSLNDDLYRVSINWDTTSIYHHYNIVALREVKLRRANSPISSISWKNFNGTSVNQYRLTNMLFWQKENCAFETADQTRSVSFSASVGSVSRDFYLYDKPSCSISLPCYLPYYKNDNPINALSCESSLTYRRVNTSYYVKSKFEVKVKIRCDEAAGWYYCKQYFRGGDSTSYSYSNDYMQWLHFSEWTRVKDVPQDEEPQWLQFWPTSSLREFIYIGSPSQPYNGAGMLHWLPDNGSTYAVIIDHPADYDQSDPWLEVTKASYREYTCPVVLSTEPALCFKRVKDSRNGNTYAYQVYRGSEIATVENTGGTIRFHVFVQGNAELVTLRLSSNTGSTSTALSRGRIYWDGPQHGQVTDGCIVYEQPNATWGSWEGFSPAVNLCPVSSGDINLNSEYSSSTYDPLSIGDGAKYSQVRYNSDPVPSWVHKISFKYNNPYGNLIETTIQRPTNSNLSWTVIHDSSSGASTDCTYLTYDWDYNRFFIVNDYAWDPQDDPVSSYVAVDSTYFNFSYIIGSR